MINDYLLIADLHLFVYGRAECASISLVCTGETSYIKYFWFKVVNLYLEILIILDEEMRRSDQLLSQMMPKSVSDKVYKYIR